MEGYPVEQCGRETLLWSRDMIERAANVHQYNPDFKINKYNTIWCGHTTTQAFVTHKMKSRLTKEEIAIEGTKPMFVCNVINLDTGAGWSGRLTIMDTATKQYWQSDFVQTLYPDIKGRWG
jgi:serine/threonine protein phosphatase 1